MVNCFRNRQTTKIEQRPWNKANVVGKVVGIACACVVGNCAEHLRETKEARRHAAANDRNIWSAGFRVQCRLFVCVVYQLLSLPRKGKIQPPRVPSRGYPRWPKTVFWSKCGYCRVHPPSSGYSPGTPVGNNRTTVHQDATLTYVRLLRR